MRKLWVIAGREYKAAVRTKAFLISLVLVPILWAASIGIQVLVHKAEDRDERRRIRYQSGKPGSNGFGRWARETANAGIQQHRFAEHNASQSLVKELQQPVYLKSKGLTGRDPATGEIRDASEESRVGSFVMPVVLMVLMYFMILVGATPAMHGVIEEKQQRISEVLLGSVSPFQLMLGKLFGVVAVALTVAAVYAIVGGASARSYGVVV